MAAPRKFDRAEAVRLYESGLGVKQIAAELGVTSGPVFRAIRKLVNMRSPTVAQFDRAAAQALYLQGISTPRIAKKLGVSTHAIQVALRRSGTSLRSVGDGRSASAKPKRINAYGYVMVRVGKRAYRLEHRMIAERALGRPLKRSEFVHHINCDRADNRNSNLLICTHEYHTALHARMRVHPYWSQFERQTS